MIQKLLCWLLGHKRGRSKRLNYGLWRIECSRCGHVLKYHSPWARLVGKEIQEGFTGE